MASLGLFYPLKQRATDRVQVGIALGSNLGCRATNLRAARERILALVGIAGGAADPGCISAPIFETDPVDCPTGSGPFLNTVIEIGWGLERPITELLGALANIETALGRPSRRPRNAPREIDLDILYAGGIVLNSSILTLPHPRLAERRFVLAPLAAIRAELTLPGQNASVSQLLARLPPGAQVRLHASHW